MEHFLEHHMNMADPPAGLTEMIRISRGHRYRDHDIRVTVDGPASIVTDRNLPNILESMASSLRNQ